MILSRHTLIISLCLLLFGCGKTDYVDHKGNGGNFSDHQGKWLVINYWATWCKPCIEEIPELNQFADHHQSDVVVLGVDFDQNQGEKLQQNISKLAIEFPVLTSNPAPTLNYPSPNVLPTTIIINPEGQLAATLVGPQTEHSLLRAISPETTDPLQGVNQ